MTTSVGPDPASAPDPSLALRVEPPATWWRRNRWYVITLPLALVLAVGGYSYRLPEYLFNREYLVALGTAEPGQWLSVSDPGADPVGEFTRDYRVQLQGVTTRSSIPGEPTTWLAELPEDTEVVEVSLKFEADPEELLRGCSAWLVDQQGRTYGTESRDLLPGNVHVCVPEDRPGPESAYPGQRTRNEVTPEQIRPASWSTTVRFLVPTGTELTELRIGWEFPDFARLKLR